MGKPMLEYRVRCRKCNQWTEDGMDVDTLAQVRAALGNPKCNEKGCGGVCDVEREPHPYRRR